jgi:CBS domain-containing protein
MQENRVHQLPIMEGERLVGIVAERDVREVLDTPLFDIITVEAIMTETPIAVAPDTPAFKAAELLNTYKISALPVVDGDHLVGLVTVNDFLSYFSRHRAPAHAVA